MARTVVWSLPLVAACCSSAPTPELPLRLRDMSDAEFFWVCDDDEVCKIHRISGESPPLADCPHDREAAYTYAWWRFFEVSAACFAPDGTGFLGNWGRIVVCEQTEDCPQLDRYATSFECIAGVCQTDDTSQADYGHGLPRRSDMEALCTGHVPRFQMPSSKPFELPPDIDTACPVNAEHCVSVPLGCPDTGVL